MAAPRIRIVEAEAFERWTPFVRPFRFGAVTVEGAFQAFVRVVVEVEGHGRATGMTAELMPPKWFDKRAERSTDDTVRDLKASLAAAVAATRDLGSDTAFGHHANSRRRKPIGRRRRMPRPCRRPSASRRSTRPCSTACRGRWARASSPS